MTVTTHEEIVHSRICFLQTVVLTFSPSRL